MEGELRRLRRGHGWKAPAGRKIFVVDRGAARFNIPADWVLHPTEDCLRICDRPPPDDSCAFGFTLLHTPPAAVAAADLLAGAGGDEGLDVIRIAPVARADRPGLQLAWREIVHRDGSGREAVSRMCVAVRDRICVLLTFDFWSDDQEGVSAAWDDALSSLELARYVRDPTIGDVDHN